jgi:putative sigma-54 modulation protein
MDIKVHGRNVEVTPRLEGYIDQKVERLDRYLPDIHEIRVDLNAESPEHQKAQITLRHARGTILRAEENSPDMFISIDSAIDKIYRQIEKYKGKRKRRQESQSYFVGYETAVQLDEQELQTGSVVRRKRFSVAPMDEEEAVEQLELLGHDFFVFLNADSGDVNVVYKRRDGDFGLLEPEV